MNSKLALIGYFMDMNDPRRDQGKLSCSPTLALIKSGIIILT